MPKFASHGSRGLPGVLADLVQQSRQGCSDSKKMEVRLRTRDAVFSNRSDIADERLEPGTVASGRHDGVWVHTRPVGQHRSPAVKGRD